MVNIDITEEGSLITLKVMGDVDASSSIKLDSAIKNAVDSDYKKILVNGSELNYISSAGLGVFMSYIHDFEKQNIKLVIFGLNEKVENVFKILGLDQLLRMVENEEEASKLINEV